MYCGSRSRINGLNRQSERRGRRKIPRSYASKQLRDDIRGLEIMRERALRSGVRSQLVEAYDLVLRRSREKLEQLESCTEHDSAV